MSVLVTLRRYIFTHMALASAVDMRRTLMMGDAAEKDIPALIYGRQPIRQCGEQHVENLTCVCWWRLVHCE